MKFLWFLLIFLALTKADNNVDLDLEVDKTGWVDLLDPFSNELHGIGSAQVCESSELLEKYRKVRYFLFALIAYLFSELISSLLPTKCLKAKSPNQLTSY